MRFPPPRSGPARDRTGATVRSLAAEAAVVMGAACVTLHGVTALAGRGDDVWVRALLLVMAAGCLPCLRQLRRGPGRRTWAGTAGMYGAMLAAHLWVVTPWSVAATPMTRSMAGPLTWTELGMWSGLVLAALQVALAIAVLACTVAPRVLGASVHPVCTEAAAER